MNVYTYSKLGNWGALGNQLFQIAGTIAHAVKDDALVKLPEWAYSKYFKVPDEYFGMIDPRDKVFDFYPDYLQDLRHFSAIEDYVRYMFQPTDYVEDSLSDYNLEKTTAVHVRRANNLDLPNHHPVCTLDYFEKALDHIQPESIMVFSDDLDWCRHQSLFKDAQFGKGTPVGVSVYDLTSLDPLPNEEAALDLHLMSKCDSHIISNSTFSLWGAWLANREKVIYPKTWYGPALDDINYWNMIPSHWVGL